MGRNLLQSNAKPECGFDCLALVEIGGDDLTK